jgi:hypothetical protein
MGLFGGTPSYTPPPAPPPAAAPATLASSTVAANAAQKEAQALGAYGSTVGKSGQQGVSGASLNTGKTTLGGTS